MTYQPHQSEDVSLKTGWPAPALMQDDHRGLFRWFASKPDARLRVREALSCPPGMCAGLSTCHDTDCPGHGMADKPFATPEEVESSAEFWLGFIAGLIVACITGVCIAFANV